MPSKSVKQLAGEVLETVNKAGRGLDLAELAGEMLGAFGGPKEFAGAYHQLYTDAPAGIAKTKLIEGVLRLLTAASAKQNGSLDLTGLLDDDLKQLLAELLDKPGVVTDAAPSAELETAA